MLLNCIYLLQYQMALIKVIFGWSGNKRDCIIFLWRLNIPKFLWQILCITCWYITVLFVTKVFHETILISLKQCCCLIVCAFFTQHYLSFLLWLQAWMCVIWGSSSGYFILGRFTPCALGFSWSVLDPVDLSVFCRYVSFFKLFGSFPHVVLCSFRLSLLFWFSVVFLWC